MHGHGQKRSLVEDACELDYVFTRRRRQVGVAGIEVDILDLRATTEQGCQRPEWCGGNHLEEIQDCLPDDFAVAELRIVKAAGHGQAKVYAPIGILQDGYGQVQWKINGIGALNMFTEGKLVDDDLIIALQLMLVDLVL